MNLTYNLIAGQNLDRLSALSDGLFAIAMTLLILDIHIAPNFPITSEHALWQALVALTPRFVAFVMSFLTLGIFWVGQQTQLNRFKRCDRKLAWIHVFFLMAVSLMPFSTALLAGFITFRIALIAYWLNFVLLGGILLWSWRYAEHAGLLSDDTTEEVRRAVTRRITAYQVLYATGALLCVINTYWSIAVIGLAQLHSVFAPRFSPLSRV